MVHKTKGIVLRTVKFGESSLICSVFTELLGLQSYMVKGVRSSKSRSSKANQLFPTAQLDLVVYLQPQKNLQIIREFQIHHIYQHLQEDIIKNGVALFAIELTSLLITGHDPQPDMYEFLENFLNRLDETRESIGNYPLFFLIQAAKINGYYISGKYSESTSHVDLHEGRFSTAPGHFPPFIGGREAEILSSLNGAESLEEIVSITLSAGERKAMMEYYLTFYQLHLPHYRELKSPAILSAILYD